ncbi:MAG: hypothetical protein EXR83_05590 [Gammaproteobacteria bacterium]|nr:hypothetical protein [Gammaproteobacteria bacterium]
MNRRIFSMVGTPILALIAATAYTEWRAGHTQRGMAVFCTAINAGTSAEDFAERARGAGYTVGDAAGAAAITATKVVYTFHRETFSCIAQTTAGGRIQHTRVEHTVTDD